MLNVIIDGKEVDLREFPLDSKVAILTGTFDPAHLGHIDIGVKSLEQGNAGNYGKLDYFLFVPHSQNPGKNPIPLNVRIKILNSLISISNTCSKMGMLLFEEGVYSSLSVTEWFSVLNEYHPLSYIRVVGADRIDHAIAENLNVHHIVFLRDGIQVTASSLPQNFYLLDRENHKALSSTLLRTGKVPFGLEYRHVTDYVKEYYPNGDFSKLFP